MDVFKVSVRTVSVARRCRAGLCFGTSAVDVEVNAEQLNALQADAYLQVDVLTDDATTKQAGEETQPNPPNANPPSGDGGVNPETPKNEVPKDDLAAVLADAIRKSPIDATASKVPTVAEVKALVDFDVNAALRDAAWALVTAD